MSIEPLPPSFREKIGGFLERVKDKDSQKSILELGFLYHVLPIEGGFQLVIEVPQPFLKGMEGVKREIEKLFDSENMTGYKIILTAARAKQAQQKHPLEEKLHLPHLKKIIAVASGKGGVGKSTIAMNLTYALKSKGLKVGLLDLDIYGPSLPTLMGLKKEASYQDGKILPEMKDGIPTMSMGYMIPPEKAVIWRGPLVQMAVQQLLRDVAWGELDILVLDLPPGTGDTQLTLAQSVPLNGALIVTTPQDLSLIDARKAIDMFQTVNVPILGIVENMGLFSCPHCAEEIAIFGASSTKKEAKKQGVPFLGSLPLVSLLRELSDRGQSVFDENISSHEQKDASLLKNHFINMAEEIL